MTAERQYLEGLVASARRRVRMQRAIDAAVAASLAACVVAIVPVLFVLLGKTPPWWWSPRELAWVVGGAALGAAVVAAWLPRKTADVVRLADRRLELESALVTSMEVIDSDDPVCRLLVQRTAAQAARAPRRRAASLRVPAVAVLVPALMTMAIAIGLQPPPAAASRDTANGSAESAAGRSLSRELQESASLLLSVDGPLDATSLATARELLRIDAALRRGAIEPAQAAALAWESVAALEPPPGTPGHATSPPAGGTKPRIRDAVADRIEIARSQDDRAADHPGVSGSTRSQGATGTTPGAVASGGGQGAGTGSTGLRAAQPRVPGRAPAAATWELPRPSSSTGGGVQHTASGDASPDARLPIEASSWLHAARRRAPAERAIVAAYLERIRREDAR